MYDICPKCQHQRQAHETDNPDMCPTCGIIFSKWLKSQLAAAEPRASTPRKQNSSGTDILSMLTGYLFHIEEKVNPVIFWSRALLFLAMCYWGWLFINMDFILNPFKIGQSFLHRVDLIFHEAGHILFIPFGRFMAILGGSLFQVMMPLIVMFAFLIKNHNPFAAAVGLWWAGQSLMDLAPYIDDAVDQKLVLLGGRTGADAPGNHDWGNIFVELGNIEKHRQVATTVDTTGSVLIIIALIWAGYILYRQFQNIS